MNLHGKTELMNEFLETGAIATFEPAQGKGIEAESATSMHHVVICGLCGAEERPVGPHKTECPNCDDYIY